ncbi:MAG TPA: CCA tRNA nucleotidyltransferase [Geminicoccaceae bacterium]|nr:CCA tRNA nucleotidyltransferase [Geminicoccaceae bacterium]
MSARADRPLAGQPWLRARASRRVLAALEADGREARFVGGCVRDGLSGRPVGDWIDLATPERPEQVIRLLGQAGLPAIPTGLAHGTVTTIADGRHFEITTLRRDLACDGRHAEVEFTNDFAADAARRDFTINAMSCDRAGRLYDYVGGRTDLAAGRVRFVGDAGARIAEDYLRILRFFRFFARYGRQPADAVALAACAATAPELRRLSGERIQAEMTKLLAAADPLPALRLMVETGVLGHVAPGPVALERLARLIEAAPESAAMVRLAALLRPPPADAEAAGQVAVRWRLSNRDAESLLAMTREPLPNLLASPTERARDLHRLGAERYADLARIAATQGEEDTRAALADALSAAASWRPKRLPVGGDDILALGVPPGPEIGELLRALEAWWVARDFAPDRAACLAEARRILAQDHGDGATEA